MTNFNKRVPKLCRHKGRDLGFVKDPKTKKIIYLGRWNSHETRRAYERWLAEYFASNNMVLPVSHQQGATVKNLVEKYILFAREYYRKRGSKKEVTSEYNCIRQALLELKDWFDIRLEDFKPSDLITIRSKIVARKTVSQNGKPSTKTLALSTINAIVGRIRRMFKKGVEWDMVPASVFQGLECVSNLSWRTAPNLRETEPIKPVEFEHIKATMEHLPEKFKVMLEVHMATGMRVTELCNMRWSEIEPYQDGLYAFRPTEHKTKHRGVDKTIFIRAELVERMRALKRTGAKDTDDSVFLSWGKGKASKYKGAIQPSGYRHAIERAQKRMNEERIDNKLPILPKWTLLQIRHSVATMVRQLHGLEAAQAMLGHSSIEATQIYAEKRTDLAAQIASKMKSI